MAGRATNAQRLDALEIANKALHEKMDAMLNALTPGQDRPVLLDAHGRELTAPTLQAPSSDNTAEMLRILLPHLHKQNPPPPKPAASLDWTKVLVAILPALLQAVLSRPDPIETLAALKELNEPDPTEAMMQSAMPLLMMKLAGTGGQVAETGANVATSALGSADDAAPNLAELLSNIDPATLAAILGGQAPTHARHVPQ